MEIFKSSNLFFLRRFLEAAGATIAGPPDAAVRQIFLKEIGLTSNMN